MTTGVAFHGSGFPIPNTGEQQRRGEETSGEREEERGGREGNQTEGVRFFFSFSFSAFFGYKKGVGEANHSGYVHLHIAECQCQPMRN